MTLISLLLCAFRVIYSASLIKLIIKLKVKIKEQKGRNFMQRATAEKKDLLNLSETIEYFNLSQRKFHSLIREKTVHDFYRFLWRFLKSRFRLINIGMNVLFNS